MITFESVMFSTSLLRRALSPVVDPTSALKIRVLTTSSSTSGLPCIVFMCFSISSLLFTTKYRVNNSKINTQFIVDVFVTNDSWFLARPIGTMTCVKQTKTRLKLETMAPGCHVSHKLYIIVCFVCFLDCLNGI